MIKHIVLFRFSVDKDKNKFLEEAKKNIENLIEIPEVHSIEAGINFSQREVAYDLSLYSEFRTKEDLEIYRTHPLHLEFVEFIKDSGYEVAVCDYRV